MLTPDEASPEGLAEAVRAATAEGVRPVREMAMGRPEHAILSAAEREDVGLLVVGHHGRSGFQRAVLGSVSEHVARHARCSVLVVRGA
ncbi:MAG: universal stress protein [Actinomycetota bacterium]